LQETGVAVGCGAGAVGCGVRTEVGAFVRDPTTRESILLMSSNSRFKYFTRFVPLMLRARFNGGGAEYGCPDLRLTDTCRIIPSDLSQQLATTT
jgi:hypothetical protein